MLRRIKQLPIVSAVLVAVNVFIYFLCEFTGWDLYSTGMLSLYNVFIGHNYSCVFLAMFLHADINHLFNNMLILFFLGTMIEKEVGHIRYAILYLLSGIGGNLISLYNKILMNEGAATLGASGAVFGLDGVLLAMVLFSKEKMPNVTPVRVGLMILLSLYNGFKGQNIDNAAHVGGLITGFVFGSIMCIVHRILKEKA